MILDVLPIIPPQIPPILQLHPPPFPTTHLNHFYPPLINPNNPFKPLLHLPPPPIILQNQKPILQQPLHPLIHNPPPTPPLTPPPNPPFKSLSHILKPNQRPFPQNLLPKRLHYSPPSLI
ncbi:hypothetical protein, partial [Staphylococcus epidermidis]|uniref:hypothetical protein n=1 Tax=Staphylococcus epidermidis TaxID=1282 RepID=UPI0037D9E7C4